MSKQQSIDKSLINQPASHYAGLVWKYINSSVDCFAQPSQDKVLPLIQAVDSCVEISQTRHWALDAAGLRPRFFRPIRSFRPDWVESNWPFVVTKQFRSSGTSQSGRSVSAFSDAGQSLYKTASLLSFKEVLKRAMPPFPPFLPNRLPRGISLIPSTSEWTDSSLAQMLAWIGEITQLDYVQSLDVDQLAKKIAAEPQEPIFVFGTAFHFVDLIDSGKRLPALPSGSIVIETGGTKGRSRSITREELYQGLQKVFGMREQQIVSEYGMCELASQAYDFVDFGQSTPLADRRFRWPRWCLPSISLAESTMSSHGSGVLMVWDLSRIDIGVPIQTEDLVDLSPNGAFKLLGRVPQAPLKGCSLRVHEVLSSSADQVTKIEKNISATKLPAVVLSPETLRCDKVMSWLKALSVDEEFFKRLQSEYKSKTIAHWAIEDFRRSLPQDAEALQTAVRKVFGSSHYSSQTSYLLIPSSSHSFASLHTLGILWSLPVSIDVRMPEIAGISANKTAFARASELAKNFDLTHNKLDKSFRIDAHTPVKSHVIVFGEDATIEALRPLCPNGFTGHGSAMTATYLDLSSSGSASPLPPNEMAKAWIKDCFSLRQFGCFSSRITFVKGEYDQIQELLELAKNLILTLDLNRPMEPMDYLESVRLQQLGGQKISSMPLPTFLFSRPPSMEAIIPLMPLTLVLVKDVDLTVIGKVLPNMGVRQLTTNALGHCNFSGIEMKKLGEGNIDTFNGTHFSSAIISKI
jgi:hypothetical protein